MAEKVRGRYYTNFVVPNASGQVNSNVQLTNGSQGGPAVNNMYVPGNPQWLSAAHTNINNQQIDSPVDTAHALITLDAMLPVVAEFLSETFVKIHSGMGYTVLECPLFHLVREHCSLYRTIGRPHESFQIEMRMPTGQRCCADLLEYLKNPHGHLVAAAHAQGLPVPAEWSITDAAIRLGADVPMQHMRGWIILEGDHHE